jgi:hypothetical protein
MHAYVVTVSNMAHLSCAPSVVLFEDEVLAVHYIYNALPALIGAELGFSVYLQSDCSAPLFTKMKAVAVDSGYDPQITVTLSSQYIHSRSER